MNLGNKSDTGQQKNVALSTGVSHPIVQQSR